MKKIISLYFILIFITGCNYRELNDMAIVSGISIDKVDNKYNIIVQVVNPTKSGEEASSMETNFITYSSSGDSLQEAFRNIVLESPKKIYGSQMQVLVLSPNIIENDLPYIIDFFARDPEVRTEFYVVIDKSYNEALKTITVLDNLSSSNIVSSLESISKYMGNSVTVSFQDLLEMFLNNNKDILLPSINVINGKSEGDLEDNLTTTSDFTSIRVSDVGIFKNNKFLGYIDSDDAIIYNFISNNINNTLINFSCDDNYLVSEIYDSKTKIDIDSKNNIIDIHIKGNASIKENTCNYDLDKNDVIDLVNKNINKKIKKMMKNSLNNIFFKKESDIYGFRDMYYKSNYKLFKKNDYKNKIFENIRFNIKSDINITEKGKILGGLYE